MSKEQDKEKNIEPVDEDNILDWDFYLKDPPLSKPRTIIMRAKYMGRAKPLPYIEENGE